MWYVVKKGVTLEWACSGGSEDTVTYIFNGGSGNTGKGS